MRSLREGVPGAAVRSLVATTDGRRPPSPECCDLSDGMVYMCSLRVGLNRPERILVTVVGPLGQGKIGGGFVAAASVPRSPT